VEQPTASEQVTTVEEPMTQAMDSLAADFATLQHASDDDDDDDDDASTLIYDNFDDDDDDDDIMAFPALYSAIAGPAGTAGNHGDNETAVCAILRDDPLQVNVRTSQGWTPLMVSGSTGQPNIMRLLLRLGANLSDVDSAGNTAADWTRHRVRGYDGDIVLDMPLHDGHAECLDFLSRAALPWAPCTHQYFPERNRRWAVELLRLGYLLSQQPRRAVEADTAVESAAEPTRTLGRGFADVWVQHLLPIAVQREPLPPPPAPDAIGSAALRLSDLSALLHEAQETDERSEEDE